jgi:hypothetical protein
MFLAVSFLSFLKGLPMTPCFLDPHEFRRPDGSIKSFTERRDDRRAHRPAPQIIPALDGAPSTYEQRRALRAAARLGEAQAKAHAEAAGRAAKKLIADNTPNHLKRPDNPYLRLAAEWKDSPRPEAARRVAEYTKMAKQFDSETDREVIVKLARFEASQDPEYARARDHHQRLCEAAAPGEAEELARLGAIAETAPAMYWDACSALVTARVAKARADLEAESVHALDQSRVLSDAEGRVAAAEALLPPAPEPEPTTGPTN